MGGLFIALSYLTFAVVGGGFALSGFAFLELASGLSSLKNCNELVIILLVSSQGLCILFQSYSIT